MTRIRFYPSAACQHDRGLASVRRWDWTPNEFLHGLDLVRRAPDVGVLERGLSEKGRNRPMSDPGRQYAIYLFGGPEAKLSVALAKGRYKVEWIRPGSGEIAKTETIAAVGPVSELASPMFDPDIAVRIAQAD